MKCSGRFTTADPLREYKEMQRALGRAGHRRLLNDAARARAGGTRARRQGVGGVVADLGETHAAEREARKAPPASWSYSAQPRFWGSVVPH